MPTFRITASESYEIEYEVEADDELDARVLFESGELDDGRTLTGGVDSFLVERLPKENR